MHNCFYLLPLNHANAQIYSTERFLGAEHAKSLFKRLIFVRDSAIEGLALL
jgi:hypothetical protein